MPDKRGAGGSLHINITEQGPAGRPKPAQDSDIFRKGEEKTGAAAGKDDDLLPPETPTMLDGRPGPRGGEARTRLFVGERPRSPAEPAPESSAMQDPVVGWLVIVKGPGKGEFLKLGYGQNSIGRGNQRVSLDFGDDQISRENHAMLTYEPRGKTFFIQPGTGKNLTYLDDAVVLSPTQLTALNQITLGATTMVLVPLCGEAFSWDDWNTD